MSISEDQNPDLYWAMRGGGGSTFGVVTSAIIAAYPRLPVATVSYSIANRDPNTSETFWAGVRTFFQTFTANADAGQYVVFQLLCNLPTQGWNCTLALIPHWANNMTAAQLTTYMTPYFDELTALGLPTTPVYAEYPSVAAAFNTLFGGGGQFAGSVSGTTHSASRIFPRGNWEDPALFNTTFAAIRHTSSVTSGHMQGFNIKVAANPSLNQNNAVHPAWRDTVLFALMANPWYNETATTDTIAAHCQQLVQNMQSWRDVSPGAGSYMNEGDINEPDFQQAFYGDHYPRLYALKQKYDPTGTFFAVTAVGSEDWNTSDRVPYYPTTNGRLCRKT